MPAPSQRRALGALFLVLALGFAGVAWAAGVAAAGGNDRVWVVTAASAALAFWMASLALAMLRRRR